MRLATSLIINALRCQQIRFVIVGTSTAILYFGCFIVFMKIGFTAVLAALVAYILSFFVGYTAQKQFAFQATSRHGTSLPRYASLQLLCALIAMASSGFSEMLGVDNVYTIGSVSTIVSACISYIISSKWVFK